MSDLRATDRRAWCLAGKSERVGASAPGARNVSCIHVLDELLLENPVKSSAHISEAPSAFFPKAFRKMTAARE